ncbi:general stress protein 39 [Paraliobacillus ryukyuensis]|uniref:NAD(P)-dependent dehydrogenase (Short-subunit alcohol dehydrogenase family) n=1 Tax=Paraliobacillus ryukyuensis TaxID=200904 RepID=A0A366E7D2_9BACI|nr:SDR family oxidoreductase [Paraliobacillus ryukyuensis]RBO98217.1 NAD(P)-dependent dehydrogenase (short-subunit alcohol dehydrogenase family) [Paraliobacillus ryukyuensis]
MTNQPKKQIHPKQHQDRQPGFEFEMNPQPMYDNSNYQGSGKLNNQVAIITGGDSGIGRAVSVHFAKEGANIAIIYHDEHQDAEKTKQAVEQAGSSCLLISGDITQSTFCKNAVKQVIDKFNKINILVNNAAVQYPQNDITLISDEQLERTFRVNIFSQFYLIRECLPYMQQGSTIINSSSITAYHGSANLIDYSATKGAITTLTRSLSQSLLTKQIRVNAVAPGPVWTPLIAASFDEKAVSEFGSDNPMKRPAQPYELAPAYVYLASKDSSYVTGQMIHVNGGVIVNS